MKNAFAILAVALACASTSATAAVSSGIKVEHFKVELFDLDPNDGIDPWISFGGNVKIRASVDIDNQVQGDEREGPGDELVSTSHSAQVAKSFSNVTSSAAPGSSILEGQSLFVQGSASAGGVLHDVKYDASSRLNVPAAFTFSARTKVVFTADVSLSTGMVEEVPTNKGAYSGFEITYAQVSIYAEGLSRGITKEGRFYKEQARRYDVENGRYRFFETGEGLGTHNYQSSISFLNPTEGVGTAAYSIYAYARGTSNITAVPEPGAFALVLGGISVLSLVSWRRRKGC